MVSTQETDTVYVISIADKKITSEIKTAKGAGPDPVFQNQIELQCTLLSSRLASAPSIRML